MATEKQLRKKWEQELIIKAAEASVWKDFPTLPVPVREVLVLVADYMDFSSNETKSGIEQLFNKGAGLDENSVKEYFA